MIYLDANIFIYSLGNVDKKTKACIQILDGIIKGKMEACTSLLTWDEFFYAIRKQMDKEKAIEESKRFLEFPNLILLRVTEETIEKAHLLAAQYNLRPRDAIHAASAITNNIKEIISDDPDFDRIKELKRIKP